MMSLDSFYVCQTDRLNFSSHTCLWSLISARMISFNERWGDIGSCFMSQYYNIFVCSPVDLNPEKILTFQQICRTESSKPEYARTRWLSQRRRGGAGAQRVDNLTKLFQHIKIQSPIFTPDYAEANVMQLSLHLHFHFPYFKLTLVHRRW